MDKICLNQMEFYGYHGVFPEENKLGQRFYVDVTLEMDLSYAGRADDIKQTVNYADVYQEVQRVVEGNPKKLIESVAEEIASVILKSFALVTLCTVKVTKPDPPIPGHYKSVAIEITRSRNEK